MNKKRPGKKLYIAEKPSVAREIAQVLGVKDRASKSQGYLSNGEHLITWALGHLVNIAEPECQNEKWKGRWSLAQLPMLPRRFKLEVLEERKRQFTVVKELLNREDVAEVVNATDAGREGELIFRRIYLQSKSSKPIKRLWASDMTEEGLKKALANLFEGEEKRNLGLAAFARAEADWLVGMNFSRLLTLKAGMLVTVGRVQTPVLQLLAKRWEEIENFKPSNYWSLTAHCGVGDETFKALWHKAKEYKESKIDSLKECKEIEKSSADKIARVSSSIGKKGQQKPPLPYDLTSLQRDANKAHGFSAQESLNIAQNLYEKKKVITYPRTDSRYLTKELFNDLLPHVRAIYNHFPDLTSKVAERLKDGKTKFQCVNDKKVTDHHAIIPTKKGMEAKSLSKNEWKIYEMISRRFLASLMPSARYYATTVWLDLGKEKYKANGKVFKEKGWLSAEPWRTAEDNPLPDLKKGDVVAIEKLERKKHKTKPPAHYSDASLLGAMETAGKLIEEDELKEAIKERGLGTPATRAQIIERLISRGYVEQKAKKRIISQKGREAMRVINAALPDLASPSLTGEWEKNLKHIELGRYSYLDFIRGIHRFVRDGVEELRYQNLAHKLPHSHRRVNKERQLGTCPLCGGSVVETPKSFGCANWRAINGACKFAIWKSFRGGEIDIEIARQLLKKGKYSKLISFESKDGKAFKASLKLSKGRVVFDSRESSLESQQRE